MEIKEYQWWGNEESPPENLKTKKQLSELGFSPVQAVGVIHCRKYDCYLYDINDKNSVRKKRALSEKQKQSLERLKEVNRQRREQQSWEKNTYYHLKAEAEAVGLCREVVKDNNFVVLDTETTGLECAEIVEIAIVDSSKKPVLNTLVKPSIPIPQEVVDIHGISDRHVQNSPTLPEIWSDIQTVIVDKTVLIYNASFDLSILKYCQKLHNLPRLKFRDYACLMNAYAQFYGEWNDYYEDYVWQPLNGEHRALGDCYKAYDLLLEMANYNCKLKAPYPKYCTWQILAEIEWGNDYLKTGVKKKYSCRVRFDRL